MKFRNILRTLSPLQLSLALSLLIGSAPALVLAQPGTSIQEATVSTDIVTLFARAAQFYPSVFVGGTGWYSYSGYTYKYFPSAGIYAGVKDGQVYLMGGAYGNTPSAKGSVTALSAAIQNAITVAANSGGSGGSTGGSTGGTTGGSTGTTVTADFANVSPPKTAADLPRLFDELTLESTTTSGSTKIVAQTKLERLGVEAVGGVSTEHMLVTLTASNVKGANKGEMWIGSDGTVRRFILDGFEYTNAALADSIGKGFVASFLLTLEAGNTAAVQLGLIAALKDNASLSQKVQKRQIGDGEYETLVLALSGGNLANYTVEITDFGSFSMATRYEAKANTVGTNSFQVLSMKLR